ncbi:PREDICTED: B3 domain-containing protein At2g33720-like [Camelina sativa]|uniref:B3 domain-containing protein At2g33720-like n=1 Tax=Camelina sativa TaxID=90675 RepID=A0ABM0ZB47_CAMSA|nr:PREDICTED: B3 domain-containing protein At2g33720-like [Camelina sativa]
MKMAPLSAASNTQSPPSAASNTQYLLYGNSSETPKESLVSTTLCLSSCERTPPPSAAASNTQYLLYGNTSENPKESFVSTTLCLSSCEDPKKRKMNPDDRKVSCTPSDNELTNQERKIKRMRNLTNKEREKDEWNGVSTELKLFKDPWIIKKVLTTSDLGQLSRLLLHTAPIENHIIIYLNEDDQNMVQEGLGITVDVYDHDTDSTYQLLLKRWAKLNSYVLNGGWPMYFVRRRGLRKGDEIGLFWDRFASRLHFRVLSRSPT